MPEADPEPERGWAFLDHTADLGVRAWAPTLEGALAQVAEGMFAYVLEADAIAATGEVRVEVEGDDLEELLLNWLDELLFVQMTDLVAYAGFEVDDLQEPASEGAPWRLVARARGEAYDPDRHGHLHEIKAVTYHGIRVQRDPPEVEVIVDI